MSEQDSQLKNEGQEENYQDIKEALEYQIDIVLRLEEERLLLIKENKIQKQKIKEMSDMLQKNSIVTAQKQSQMRDVETQASIQIYSQSVDVFTQTDFNNQNTERMMMNFTEADEDLDDSVLQYSQNQSIMTLEDDHDTFSIQEGKKPNTNDLIQKAQQLLKKSEQKIQNLEESSQMKKKPIQKSNLPIKTLSFKKKDASSASLQSSQNSSIFERVPTEKENTSVISNTEKKKEQNDIIAQELVKLTRENNTMRKEMQKIQELSKKQQKESIEMKKLLEVKNEMLDKLRMEVAELSLVLNNDKFKSIRTIEYLQEYQNQNIKGDFKKQKQINAELKKDYERVFEEKNEIKEELSQFKGILSKITDEYDKINNKNSEGDAVLKKENERLKEQIQQLEDQSKFKTEQMYYNNASVQEMKTENQKLMEEIEYYKHVSIKSKEYAQKAIQDIDFYRNILKQHNINLS